MSDWLIGALPEQTVRHWWIPPRSGRGNKHDGYTTCCGHFEIAPWRTELVVDKPDLPDCVDCWEIVRPVFVLAEGMANRKDKQR